MRRRLAAPVLLFLLLLSGLGLSHTAPGPDRAPRSAAGYVTLLSRGAVVESEPVPVPVDSYGGFFLRWSPDGRYLLYNTGADIYRYDAGEAEARSLTGSADRWELMPSWSPDGEQVAFTTRPMEPQEGKPLEPEGYPWVTMFGCFCGNPAVVRRDGSNYRVLGREDALNPPSWSPDGRLLAYDGGGEIHLKNLETGTVRELQPGDVELGARYLGAPAWAPERPELAFFFAADNREPTREAVLSGRAARVRQGYAVWDNDAAQVRVIYEYRAPFQPRGPALWSADGERLALPFGCALYLCDPLGLIVADRMFGRAEQVAEQPYQAAWEPGGKRLAYIDNRDRRRVVVLTPGAGGWQQQVLEHRYSVEGMAWRPSAGR